jgi:hypothetical protein
MRASTMPNADVDHILSSRVQSEVLLVFTRLYYGDSDLLENCHPSLIRQAFEMAIQIKVYSDWFAEARNTLECLLKKTRHTGTIDETTAWEERTNWHHMFASYDNGRFTKHAYESSALYRTALLDFTTSDDKTGAVE